MQAVGKESIFVTGGSGFLGRQLIADLIKEGARVKALARSERSAAIVRALGAEAVPQTSTTRQRCKQP